MRSSSLVSTCSLSPRLLFLHLFCNLLSSPPPRSLETLLTQPQAVFSLAHGVLALWKWPELTSSTASGHGRLLLSLLPSWPSSSSSILCSWSMPANGWQRVTSQAGGKRGTARSDKLSVLIQHEQAIDRGSSTNSLFFFFFFCFLTHPLVLS